MLRPADSDIRPNSSLGRQCWIGLYLRNGEPGWASDALEVSHIPQGLFETLLSLLRLLWSLLCNHVSMRQFGCTAPLLYRGNCQLLCAQTVPINSASVESCLPICPFDLSSSKHKQLKFLNLFYIIQYLLTFASFDTHCCNRRDDVLQGPPRWFLRRKRLFQAAISLYVRSVLYHLLARATSIKKNYRPPFNLQCGINADALFCYSDNHK